jgi:hypothetical protein
MKNLLSKKLFTIILLSCSVSVGCASNQANDSGSRSTPEARQAIKNASDAIATANENNWIWSETEDLLKQAQAAADKGDNATAIKLADKAKFQAEAADIQYNYEKDHPRGL